ncbi:MAG: hypothetical protein O3C57_00525 [Verrucomicrobia bacterium]|nr:hypothetical protein [Verrucomicrobiota bacterium]
MSHPYKVMLATIVLCAGATAGPLHAEQLSLRLVEAHNESNVLAAGLSDVSDTLRKNLPYSGFDLLGSSGLPLPANGTAALGAGISARCSGPQNNLTIVITRNRQQVLSTTLNLHHNTPVILGGFTSTRGRMLVLLVAR